MATDVAVWATRQETRREDRQYRMQIQIAEYLPMRNTLNRPFLLAGAALALASAPSHAINKCTDAGGQITFTDAPCPEDTHSEKLTLSSNTTTPATSQPGTQTPPKP